MHQISRSQTHLSESRLNSWNSVLRRNSQVLFVPRSSLTWEPNNTLEVESLCRKLFVLLASPLPASLRLPDRRRQNENKFSGEETENCVASCFSRLFSEDSERASGRTSAARLASPQHVQEVQPEPGWPLLWPGERSCFQVHM